MELNTAVYVFAGLQLLFNALAVLISYKQYIELHSLVSRIAEEAEFEECGCVDCHEDKDEN